MSVMIGLDTWFDRYAYPRPRIVVRHELEDGSSLHVSADVAWWDLDPTRAREIAQEMFESLIRPRIPESREYDCE